MEILILIVGVIAYFLIGRKTEKKPFQEWKTRTGRTKRVEYQNGSRIEKTIDPDGTVHLYPPYIEVNGVQITDKWNRNHGHTVVDPNGKIVYLRNNRGIVEVYEGKSTGRK